MVMIYREADIDQARKGFKNGADLPALATKLLKLGVEHYDYRIQDGTYSYFGATGYVLDYVMKPTDFGQVGTPNSEQVTKTSADYLAGQSQFSDFVEALAKAGVSLITVNLKQKKIDYSGVTGIVLGSSQY